MGEEIVQTLDVLRRHTGSENLVRRQTMSPAASACRRDGQHEAQWMDDMVRGPRQDLAFFQRLAHQAKLELLKIVQAAMDQLARVRRRHLGNIAAFDQQVMSGFHRMTLLIHGRCCAKSAFKSHCKLRLIPYLQVRRQRTLTLTARQRTTLDSTRSAMP